MQSSKEEQRAIRKPSSVINAKKQREKKYIMEGGGGLEISSRRLEIPRKHFIQSWAQYRANGMGLTEVQDIKKRWQEIHRGTIQKISS